MMKKASSKKEIKRVYTVKFPEKQQDKSLALKIIDNELPGVLNWVLDGLKRLTANKAFTDSDIVTEQVIQYKNEADTSYLFIEESGYVPDIENNKPLRELYMEYKGFCKDNNYMAFSSRNFKKRLQAHGFETRKTNLGQVVFCIVRV